MLILLCQCDVKSRGGLFHLGSPGKGTDCSVDRNLPVHAGLVTTWCEATGTTYPFIERRHARERVALSASVEADGVPGWAVSVSECELLINVVIRSKPKALSGLSQKARSRMSRLTPGAHGQIAAGEEAEPNLLVSFMRNTVSPIVRPRRRTG